MKTTKLLHRNEDGVTTIGVLLALTAIFVLFLCVIEFYRAFTIKQSLDAEISRALNTAVDMAMIDQYRQDHISELNPATAYDAFYAYLFDNMELTSDFKAFDKLGREIYVLDIERLDIDAAPPKISVTATAHVRFAYVGNIVLDEIRFMIRGSSENRRLE